MKYFLLSLFSLFSISCLSQNDGLLLLEKDARLDQLIQKQKEIHSADNTIDGFRVQIFMESGNDAVDIANATMSEFKEKYPDVPVYLIFGQPYYRLRVGDFRTRLEAEKFFHIINKEYKNAFVTSDKIQLPYNIFCDDSFSDIELRSFENDTIDMEMYYYDE